MLDTKQCQKPLTRSGFRGIRSSKFRHVYGAPFKKDQCYDNVKITRSAHDSNFCAVNPKFIAAVVEVGGGGSFLVLPLNKTGKIDHLMPKVSGHSGPVLDIKWNPFNDNIIASASEDCTVKLWYIPDGGLTTNLDEFLVELQGHKRRVLYLEWHPTAENILLSAGHDHVIIVWNIAKGCAVNVIDCHVDTIYSMSFNRNGSLLATTSRDKCIRIIDPRSGEVLRQGDSHMGNKASKVVYLGDTGRLLTTGFSKFSDRQYAVWSQNDLTKPLVMEDIDSSSFGVCIPYYDNDSKIVYLAGKGDGNMRYYEVIPEEPYVFYLSQFVSGATQRGFGVLPKRGIDTARCEIFRFYKLHATKDLIEPISMIVPRKSEIFHDDIYPETVAPMSSLTAEDWVSGQNAAPVLMSLRTKMSVHTFKPLVFKPTESPSTVSDINNEKKFSFLSTECTPDYRPLDRRTKIAQIAQMDHRPLGADSYQKQPIRPSSEMSNYTKSNNNNNINNNILNNNNQLLNKTTKFQEIHKRWSNGSNLSKSPIQDQENKDPHLSVNQKPFFPLGSITVKSLTSRFGNSDLDEEGLKSLVEHQQLEIIKLKSQLSSRDKQIAKLEEELKNSAQNY